VLPKSGAPWAGRRAAKRPPAARLRGVEATQHRVIGSWAPPSPGALRLPFAALPASRRRAPRPAPAQRHELVLVDVQTAPLRPARPLTGAARAPPPRPPAKQRRPVRIKNDGRRGRRRGRRGGRRQAAGDGPQRPIQPGAAWALAAPRALGAELGGRRSHARWPPLPRCRPAPGCRCSHATPAPRRPARAGKRASQLLSTRARRCRRLRRPPPPPSLPTAAAMSAAHRPPPPPPAAPTARRLQLLSAQW